MPSACKLRKCRSAAAEGGVGARTEAILILEAIACMTTDRGFAPVALRGGIASLVGAILCFTASAAWTEEPLKLADSQLEPVKWTELASWRTDDHLAAFAAYQTSCLALRRILRTDDHGPIHSALWNVCRKAIDLQPKDSDTARNFFEQNFQPVRIARLGEVEGFLTGYFEPIVQGSRFPNPEFHIPLYRRPPDLVAAGDRHGDLTLVSVPGGGPRSLGAVCGLEARPFGTAANRSYSITSSARASSVGGRYVAMDFMLDVAGQLRQGQAMPGAAQRLSPTHLLGRVGAQPG